MSTPFLLGFSTRLVGALVARELVEVEPGREEEVSWFLAVHLSRARAMSSLVSTVSTGLLACPDVVELYADDEELKRAVEALGTP